MYDTNHDSRYCPSEFYKGFGKDTFKFIWNAINQGRNAEFLILTHINLALPALLIKFINPSVKIFLIAHGIEIWAPLTKIQARLLKSCYKILAVSKYTKKRIGDTYPSTKKKIDVLNNCLDPFYVPATTFEKPEYLQKRYGIKEGEKVMITLCRLVSTEKYKGYDTVIESLAELKKDFRLKYVLLGKYDDVEYSRLSSIIEQECLQEQVILAGFVKDEELADHFLLGDLFIMPSVKEGFGIVFIEAAASGMPVIAGNKDGSVDAMLDGRLGPLVEPFDKNDIRKAIASVFHNPPHPKTQQYLALNHFNYTTYKDKLKSAMLEVERITANVNS
nr:glycosyltransferase family 4 protein [Pedobacter sp. SYSU D00873]